MRKLPSLPTSRRPRLRLVKWSINKTDLLELHLHFVDLAYFHVVNRAAVSLNPKQPVTGAVHGKLLIHGECVDAIGVQGHSIDGPGHSTGKVSVADNEVNESTVSGDELRFRSGDYGFAGRQR